MAPNDPWATAARRVFRAYPSVATVSIVSRELASTFGYGSRFTGQVLQAAAAFPDCLLNDDIAQLLGVNRREEQIEAATRRGLHHAWIVVTNGGATDASLLLPSTVGDNVVIASLPVDDPTDTPMAVGIDAAWLLGRESGAQVFVFETLKAMAKSEAIARIVLLSDSGGVPSLLGPLPKISGRSWADALSSGERLDILHRPYQPGGDADFGRYRQVARAVVVTVLDFIAYDNPAYHESPFAFREYQRSFDDHIRAADQVLAISRHIGDRIQRQFAHRLLAPVRSIYPGADHLADERIASEAPSILDGVTSGNFLAVLGNDFAHKNRDFAVKVFAEMCGRGYQGHLVLAGFHLDSGASYHYELDAAGPYRERVFRVGPLAPDEKKWLLHNAQCVLYPTSSEGFGLIPFEAAAFGAPTAFVRFGPLNETMPNVPAVRGWNVNEFASHVFALIADPAGFVASVKRDAVSLTWQRCAAETIAIYREMLGDRATWHAALANRERPDTLSRLHEAAAEYWRRAGGKMRRLTGRNSPGRER